MGLKEDAVPRTIPILSALIALALPAQAQDLDSACFRRFNICAEICAALRENANDGCLGRCLRTNGCTIDSGGTRGDGLAASALPRDTLPKGTLPGSTLPDSLLK